MEEDVKEIIGHFWQRILTSDKQASFIKMAREPLGRAFTISVKAKEPVSAMALALARFPLVTENELDMSQICIKGKSLEMVLR